MRKAGVYGRTTRACQECGSLKVAARGLCMKHYQRSRRAGFTHSPVLDLARIQEYRKVKDARVLKRAAAEMNKENRRWKWAIENPLHLAPEHVWANGTDGLVLKHLTSWPCPKCGAPPIFSECAICMRLAPRTLSRSDASAGIQAQNA
jgi:hypothetical protein